MFASIFTLQKETLEYCEPFFLIGSRMLFAGIMLLGYLLITNRGSLKNSLKHFWTFLLLALFAVYLTNICEIWAIKHMISSKACLLYSSSPFLAALVAFFVLGERLSKQKWLGMLIGFFGLIPIHFTQTNEEISLGSFTLFSIAELSMLGAVFFSTYGWILLKKLASEFKHSPLLANGISMTIGGIFALVHSYFSGESWDPIPVTQLQPFLINSLIMCLVSNIICYNLYGFLLKRFTATFMSFTGLVTPFFASLYGYIFLHEQITWHFFASIIMFSLGLVLFYQDEIKQGQAFRITKSIDDGLAAV
jgi:drug/metabolite transporter (DMT)-like permease